MKAQKVSKTSIVITVVALAVLVFLLIRAQHHMSTTAAPVAAAPTTSSQPQTVCYYLDQPSKGAQGNDIAYLKLTDGGNSTVSGTLGVALAEKDTEVGKVSGVLTNGTNQGQYVFNAQYVSESEGMNTTTQQRIVLDSNQAQVDYGTYSLSIPRVDCSQYPGLV